MNLIIRTLLFLLANTIGCFMAAILFVMIIVTDVVDLNAEGFNAPAFREWFVIRVMSSWLICGLFSFSIFFIDGKWKYIFLLAPVIVPLLYGLSLIFTVSIPQ